MRNVACFFIVGVLPVLPLLAQSSRFKVGDYWYRIIDNTPNKGKVLLSWSNQPGGGGSAYSDVSGKVVVPETVTQVGDPAVNYQVTGIDIAAFFGCGEIDSVVFPARKHFTVGDYAFQQCSKLKEVVSFSVSEGDTAYYFGFSSSIDSVGIFSFAGCGFEALDFAADTMGERTSKLDTLWGGAFSDCVELNTVIIGPQIKNIRAEAFGNAEKLSFVRLEQGEEELTLDTLAFTKSDAIKKIYVRYQGKLPILEEGKPLSSVFKGIQSSCVVYVPYASIEEYTKPLRWGGWQEIRPSYALTITEKKDVLYSQRLDTVRYTFTHCGDSVAEGKKGEVTWSSSKPEIASVAHKKFPPDDGKIDYAGEITTNASPGKTYIKVGYAGEEEDHSGEGVSPDSFLLTVRNVIEIALKRTKEGAPVDVIQDDTLFIHVHQQDTLKTFLRFYGSPDAEAAKKVLVQWKPTYKQDIGHGGPYITRTVKDDTSFISSSGHDTVTYLLKVENTEYPADSFRFTIISPRIKIDLISSHEVDGVDSIDLYRATFLNVSTSSHYTVGREESVKEPYPFVWKIVENEADDDGRPVADTATVPSGYSTYTGSLRVKGRRPGVFKILALTESKDSVPSDTLTVVVKDPAITVEVNKQPSSSSLLVNRTDTVYPEVKFFKREVKGIKYLAGIASAYGVTLPITNDPEWEEWVDKESKVAGYLRELTRLDSLIKWKVKAPGEDIIACQQYNKSDSALLTGLRHGGGEAEVIATYDFLKKFYRDTLKVTVPPIQAVIYDREGDGKWSNTLMPDWRATAKRGYLNRKDTIGVHVSYIGGEPIPDALKGSSHFSMSSGGLTIDSVRWTSLTPQTALVNDSGIVSFIDTGAVQIRVTTLREVEGGYEDGVSDTVAFRVNPPEICLLWERLTTSFPGDGTSGSPDTIRLGRTDTVKLKLTCDGLLVDTLSSQLQSRVLDSTVLTVAREVDGVWVKADTFLITALAHTAAPGGSQTKLWLGDSVKVGGKKYAVTTADSFWVYVPPVYAEILLPDYQLERRYVLNVRITHDEEGEEPVEPKPLVYWRSLTPLTAKVSGTPDSVYFQNAGHAEIRMETYYRACVGNKYVEVKGVVDTFKREVQKPKITVNIDEISARQTMAPHMTVNAVVKWKDTGQETDLFGLRWVSRNEKVFTVDPASGEVTFISNSVAGGEAYLVTEVYHSGNPLTVLGKDSLKIVIDAPVIRVAFEGAAPDLRVGRSVEIPVQITQNGETVTHYNISWNVMPIAPSATKTLSVDWNASTRKLRLTGIAAGESELEARVEGKKVAGIVLDVPAPVIKVEKVSPEGAVFLSLRGGNSVLQASVSSDGELLTSADSVPLTWSVSPSGVIQYTKPLGHSREVLIQALSPGEAVVTATTAGGEAASWEVAVPAPYVTVKIPNKVSGLELQVDTELSLPEPEVQEEGERVDNYSLEWTVRDASLLEVNGRKLKAKKVGSTWAVVTLMLSGVTKLDSIQVKVLRPQVEITLTPGGNLSLGRGGQQQLSATVRVNGITVDYPVSWASSSPSRLTVTDGLLTATPLPGADAEIATLTATVDSRWGDGPWHTTTQVTLRPSVVAITPVTLLLQTGQTQAMPGFPVSVDGQTPDDLTGWASGNAEVVSVASNGLLTALKAGSTYISLPLLGQEATPTVVAYVTVVEPVVPEEPPVITLALPIRLDTIPVHGTSVVQATVTRNGEKVDTIPVTFEVLTPELVQVQSSTSTSLLLRATNSGQVRVKASVRGGTIVSGECIFVIRKPVVTVTLPSQTLAVRGYLSATAMVEYSPGDIETNMQQAGVRWSVSDTSILAVDTLTGLLQGRKAGEAALTARVPGGGFSAPLLLTVLPPETSIRIQGTTQPLDNVEIRMNQPLSLQAAVVYNGVPDLSVPKVWETSDGAILGVDEFFGIVSGKLPGLAEVRVRTLDGGRDTLAVRVLPPAVFLSVTPENNLLTAGTQDSLLFTAFAGYDAANRLPEVPVIWSVTPEGIVWLSPQGKLTPLAAGTALIRVSLPALYGGASEGYTVTVKEAKPDAVTMAPAGEFSARITATGLYVRGLLPQQLVEVSSPDGRIVLRAHAGDGFIAHTFSGGIYLIRAGGAFCKVLLTF